MTVFSIIVLVILVAALLHITRAQFVHFMASPHSGLTHTATAHAISLLDPSRPGHPTLSSQQLTENPHTDLSHTAAHMPSHCVILPSRPPHAWLSGQLELYDRSFITGMASNEHTALQRKEINNGHVTPKLKPAGRTSTEVRCANQVAKL